MAEDTAQKPAKPTFEQRLKKFLQVSKQQTKRRESFHTICKQMGVAIMGCYAGSFIIMGRSFKEDNEKRRNKQTGVLARFRYVFNSTFFIQTSVSFCAKILVDTYKVFHQTAYAEYQKGAVVGIISFLINTPLKNIHKIQQKVLDPSHRPISKSTAISFLMNMEGYRAFFAGELLVNGINSILFYSLYFGVYHNLTQTHSNQLQKYFLNPFLASTAATIPSFIIGKFSNLCHMIKTARIEQAIGSGKKIMPKYRRSVLVEALANSLDIFKMSRSQGMFHFYGFLSNWLMLAIFFSTQDRVFGQGRNQSLKDIVSRYINVIKGDPLVGLQ